MDIKHKDTVEQMRGCWIVELSEMEMVSKSDVQALKAFITRTKDRVRPAYKRSATDFPRQCVFIGTVNPDGSGYLRYSTGNSRFWPVHCSKFNISGLRENIDQIWAEAVHRFREGEPLYLEGLSKDVAEQEANKRYITHPWSEIISQWAADNPHVGEITTKEIYQNVLSGSITTLNTAKQRDIARCLKDLGWTKVMANRTF